MTYAPQTLTDLANFWKSKGGVNLGVVGDQKHAVKGYSYHLGKDQLAPGAYSAKTARDRHGLTNAASAIDLGKLGGSFTRLRVFSSWLVSRARANAPGTADIREIIWTPNGKDVYRWDRERGFNSAPKTGEADNTHLTHTHISFYRDSELRGKRALFDPFFGVTPPDTSTGDVMPNLATYTPGHTITVKPSANVRNDAKLAATVLRAVKTPEVWEIVGSVKGDVDQGSDVWYLRWAAGHWEYTAKSNVTAGPTAPTGTDCTAAVTAAITADRAKARITYP